MAKKSAPSSVPPTIAGRNGAASDHEDPESDGKDDEKEKDAPIIKIPKFSFQTIHATVVGTAPLHVNCFPEKLKQEMREKRLVASDVQSPTAGGKKKTVNRAARDFEREYRDSLYPIDGMDGSYGFPAIAFKKAIVGACRQTNMEMTLANRIIFVDGPVMSRGFKCVKIIGKPKKVEIVVRLAGMDRPPDIRYLGEFWPWEAILKIEFNRAMISQDGIVNLLRYAGKCEGVGEQRPSSRKSAGDFGTFTVKEVGVED